MKKKKFQGMKGMTLIEAIISVGIFTIGTLGFSMLLVNSFKINSFIIEEGQAAAKASSAVNSAIDYLRRARQSDNGAYPLSSGDSNDLVFYADIDNDKKTERVHYFFDRPNQLFKMGYSEPSEDNPPTYGTTDTTVRTLSDHVVNSTSEPIFYYFNKNYPGDTSNNPLSVPINPQDVRLIKVHLIVNIKPHRAPEDTNIESFAELRNLNEYNL